MKSKPIREDVLELLYAYGWEATAKLLNVSVDELDNIINSDPPEWKKPHINVNATVEYINPNVSDFIEKNYVILHSKYVKNKDYSVFWQNDEDIFHTALIKLCSDLSNPSEELIRKQFDKIFKNSKRRYEMNFRQMKRKEQIFDDLTFTDNIEETE